MRAFRECRGSSLRVGAKLESKENGVTSCDIHVLMREQERKESDNVHNRSLATEKNSALIIIPSSVSRCVKTSPSPDTKR